MEQYLGNSFPIAVYEIATEECIKHELYAKAREYLLKCRLRGVLNYEQLIEICILEGNIDEAYLQTLNSFEIGRSPSKLISVEKLPNLFKVENFWRHYWGS